MLFANILAASVCLSIASGYTVGPSLLPIRFPVQAANPQDPITFVRSDESGKQILRCPARFRFSSESMKCVRTMDEKGVELAVCSANYMGPSPYQDDCRMFVNCWMGRGYLEDCPDFLVYRHERLACDWAGDANCCEYWEKDSAKLVA